MGMLARSMGTRPDDLPPVERMYESVARTCDIEMPTVASARDVCVRMTSRELSVGTRRDRRAAAGVVSLDLATPFPVDDDASELMFDASTRVMKVVMPVLARTRARADEHAEFLTRYEAARARAAHL